MMNFPNPAGGDGLTAKWLNKFRSAARSRGFRTSRGINARQGSGGIFISPQARSSGPITTWHFKSMDTDFIVCRSWDGTNEGSEDVKIAKPPELRFSIVTETIDGTDVTYDGYDLDAQTRFAHDGTTDETQVIVPRYLVDSLVYVCRANSCGTDEDENPIGLLDLNVSGRAWAAVPAE